MENYSMKYTGERMIPGQSPKRIELDHYERYLFACKYVKFKKVLDIGCGVGYGVKLLVTLGKAIMVDAIDVDEETIEYSTNNFNLPEINYLNRNILSFLTHQLYDIAICFETIEHIPEYRKALINIYTNLKKHGVLILSTPNRIATSPEFTKTNQTFRNKYHYHEFTIEEMVSELRSAGFKVDTDHGIYGQRLCTLSELSNNLNDIKNMKSAKVQLIANLIPRYFIIIAIK